jgi:hypothetical protein
MRNHEQQHAHVAACLLMHNMTFMLLHMQGTAYEDLEAAKWYEGCHKSTTNEARNSDVQEFWQSCKGNAAGAIKDLTGAQHDANTAMLSRPGQDCTPGCTIRWRRAMMGHDGGIC